MAATHFADLERSATARVVHRYSPDDLLSSAKVREILGGISDMTLYRWAKEIDFPKPDYVIARKGGQGRRFWRHSTVQAWLAVQAAKQGGA